MGATATARGRAAASAVGGSRSARVAARCGLAARTGFYLLLAGLVVRMAVDGDGSGGRQTNAHGALSVIAQSLWGKAAIAAAALGFVALGVVRIAGAVRDGRAEDKERLLTALQGVFYLGVSAVPLSFLFGSRQAGSEQAQHRNAATVLRWPLGRELVVVAGLVVIGVCGYQIHKALTQDFTEDLDLRRAPRWICRIVGMAGTVGLAARALVFLPIGVFLIVAAVQSDPQHADGLDAELALLAHQSWWGPAILGLVAGGLVVFAVYSAIESRYRRVAHSS